MSSSRQVFSAAELFRWNEAGCSLSSSRSPFYAAILARCATDCDAGSSPFVDLLELAPMTIESAPPLRMMGAVHRGVLSGEFADLSGAWPSAQNPIGDERVAFDQIRSLCEAPPTSVLDIMTRDPQTNEVGRSAGLALGLAIIHARTGLQLRLLEIGASAGLNLRVDQYLCETGGWRWGPSDARLRFDAASYVGNVHTWIDSAPQPAVHDQIIVERRGCDINPIDPTSTDGALSLMSYVWPDQFTRLERLRRAIEIAQQVPATVERASADDWLDENLSTEPGVATVVMHSVMWQYMPDSVQERCRDLLTSRGRLVSPSSALYELSMEPTPGSVEMVLDVTDLNTTERLAYARAGGHGPPIEVR